MAASVQCREEEMSCGETKEKGDDLSLFVDFNGANLNIDLHKKSNQFQELFNSESDNPMMPETRSTIIHVHHPAAVDLLNSENNASDYDWLLSPPRNSVPSLEMEEQKTLTSQHLISNGQSTSPKSRLENPPLDTTSTTKVKVASKLPSSSIKSSNATIRRPSPSRKPPSTVSRSSTPTTKPSRSSTPTPRPTIPAIKPPPPSKRSTTPTARSSTPTARSSTPTARPSILPRSSTPTTRPSIPATSKSSSTLRSSTPTQRPTNSSVNKTRSTSVTKARDPPPPSIKKSLPERPASASRGRPGLTETNVKQIPKRASLSPLRGPVSNGGKTGGMKNRGYSNGNDEVNPVLMGTKMVERVVNMRKLAPPREDRVVNQNNTCGKLSVSQDNAGFGRTLSKKSFDMALRHLDIRRSMPGNMRAMITKIPASSVYSVRSESVKNHTISASDSPLATSSSASSDHSIGNNQSFVDGEITNKISMGFENGH
ncbi:unnamed protein product [Lactuca virosa]|uniref:Uncharacterized protein n=1 Tax=Lactuca virosa TaxID=75947 RepID=A0AAU9N7M4_9ASTR|nr:unnamed protein product [Lactuca virosa]